MDNNLEQNNILREGQRSRKKIIIATVPIFGLILIIALVFIINLPNATCFDGKQNGNETGVDCGGSCVTCAIKNAKSLEIVSQPVALDVGSDFIAISAKIRNSNVGYGVKFTYQINFLDSFGQIKNTISDNSYIYPSSAKFLVIPKVEMKKTDFSRMEIVFDQNSFEWFASEKTSKDLFSIYDVQAQFLEDAKNPGYLKVTGKINNKMTNSFPLVDVVILVYSKTGELLNAVKTGINNLSGNTTQQFEYTWMAYFPNLQQSNLNKIEVYPDSLMQ
ncbi:MAG TPA: hypothetical protein PLQ44_00805 [Candidatus Paceibacterota bacterium]|nr:hypothetical protein [Candidatus Paceibacterota bacterium]HPT40132.1 hypothetical protein [Candidatus Paceibacterota bacterium]